MMLSKSKAFQPLLRKAAARSLATQVGSSSSNGKAKDWKFEAAAAAALSAVTMTSVAMMEKRQAHYKQPDAMVPAASAAIPEKPRLNQPPPRPDLPIYTREEVSEHTDQDSLWYTFRGGVYDLVRRERTISVFALYTLLSADNSCSCFNPSDILLQGASWWKSGT